MSDPIELNLDDEDRLAELPLVDSLHYEDGIGGISITFVPSTGDNATRTVFVRTDSAEGKRVSAFLYAIQQLLGQRVERVTHSGGGDYALRLASGTVLNLSDNSTVGNWAPDVFDRLKQVAETAEIAFEIEHATHH
jgi:hypothetical protein